MSDKLQVVPKTMRVNGKDVTVEGDTTLVPARSLEALANTVRHEHDLVVSAGQKMLEHVVLCGDALLEAKRQVPRGKWLVWMKDNFPFAVSTGNFYMRASFYVDSLREHGIETNAAAKAFLRDHDLYREATNLPIAEGTVNQIHNLRTQGLSRRAIADALGITHPTVSRYLNDPQRDLQKRGPEKAPRRHGRKAENMRRAITDDLVEGAAIKLRELFISDEGEPTAEDRKHAEEILRAAFTYDGPIPEGSEVAA